MKLSKFIKESVSDEYMDAFHKYLIRKYKGKKLNGWSLSVDRMSGTFYWDNPTAKHTVMATPFWDGNEKLPIDVMDADGDETELSISYPFKSTGNMSKDELNYLKLLKPVFAKIR